MRFAVARRYSPARITTSSPTPIFSMRLGDGRNFLLTTPNKYDLITSDTIQPYDAGSTNLYSADYYGLALNALARADRRPVGRAV